MAGAIMGVHDADCLCAELVFAPNGVWHVSDGDGMNVGVRQVLMELKEYAYAEVDVDFVRKCVRAIGRCALKIESSAERCVAVLVDLIQVPGWVGLM